MSDNFQKQLDSILKTSPQKYNTPQAFKGLNLPTSPITVFQSAQNSSIFSKVFYLLIGVFIVMLFLVAINFLIYPIFPSWLTTNISVPGADDSKLFWNIPPPLNQVVVSEQPFSNIAYNYTVMFDIQIDNATMRLGQSRVFMNRGPGVLTDTVSENIYKLNPEVITHICNNFNFVVYCDPFSTNMNIAVTTIPRDDTSLAYEKVSIKNFPIQKSIRIAIVLLQNSMELYLNGLLYTIRKFSAPLNIITGPINPPLDSISSSTNSFGRIQNLRLWRRTLLSKEIRSWGSGAPFPTVKINDTCTA